MKAIVCPRYGTPDVLELQEVEKPTLEDNRVLVRVKAASVNPVDRHLMRGGLIRMTGEGLLRPKRKIRGIDVAGQVEAVGRSVTQFRPGDEVFGTGPGAYAEYVCAREDRVVSKPARITFQQAAAMPVAGITALQALRDWGKIRPGQKVLINGASGGVGTFAVQIAKSFGAEVTAVCSTGNVEQAKLLGADRVIDYTREDFARSGERYDLILDNAGNRSLSVLRHTLVPNGTLVLNAAPRGAFIGFIARLLSGLILSKVTPKKVAFHIAKMNRSDLNVLRELVEEGKMTPAIDRSYPLNQVPDAIRYWEEGHARAKIVITV
ncbi:MAG: NAD(P)-dependent alcohol dehydrogenase [Thaumarchaeota archaeon]|nr:NAD(P)-dependent alcohol dehydrogenase [Nitrososphaerota archaeon]